MEIKEAAIALTRIDLTKKRTMKTQLYIAVCVLTSAGLATAQTYHIPTVSLDTPDNSVCPPDAQLEIVRNSISANLSDILVEIAANKTFIPECGGSGWRRVAFLDMTDPDQTCPSSWRLFSQGSVRACARRETNTSSCDSVQFSPDGYEYTQVCGRIVGYQYASPDGYIFSHHFITLTPGNEINEPYVDGVSVTYGAPRQHIWTLYGGLWPDSCCDTINTVPLSFLENNYFCDTGNPAAIAHWNYVFFHDYPLWDGISGCDDASCCAPHSGPWFNTTLTAPTTDDIEIRICGDQNNYIDEDTPLELVEIYIK